MPRVLNIHQDPIPPEAVNCMRPGPWGNMFALHMGFSREEAVKFHRDFVLNSPEFQARIKASLKGKDLACCCAPAPCHCDILLEIANA